MNKLDVNDLLSTQIIKNIKQDIETASSREVCIIGDIDQETEKVKDYRLVARGNRQSVPAIISDLHPGQIVIHNHPGGDLRPSAADIKIGSQVGNQGIGFAIINNEVSSIYVIVEPKIPSTEQMISKKEIMNLFAAEGKLSEHLQDYEYREQQLQVVENVIDTFNRHKNTFVEAGTGTGKSIAYLIPALYWNKLNQEPVVVSTNTINLQEQLINKDLVLLKKVLDFPFKSVLVKGRSNYVCRRKLNLLSKRSQEFFENEPEKQMEYSRILHWIEDTETGTRSDVNFVIDSEIWSEIASESDLCLNTACPYFDKCFFMNARKEIFSADLLIVNHHLLLSDASLKERNMGILPEYSHLIIDEAHNFADIATYHLGRPFYYPALNKLIQRLDKSNISFLTLLRNQLNVLDSQQQKQLQKIIDNKIIPRVQQVQEISNNYFSQLDDFHGDKQQKMLRLTAGLTSSEAWYHLVESGEKLGGFLKNLGVSLKKLYEELQKNDLSQIEEIEERLLELESALNTCQQLAGDLDFNLNTADDNYVYWLEKEYRFNDFQVSQKNAPLNISSLLPEILWKKLDNVIFTSATLTVNKSFDFFKNNLGLKESDELQIESPFDYKKQARLAIPFDIPSANDSSFPEEIIEDLTEMLISYGGSTMVLFTSYRMLNYCVDETEHYLNAAGINLLPQGRFPRHYIIDTFKNNSSQIIYGTVSFWEGVDIRGEDLRYLIIMKLPFPVPSRPVAAAKREKLKEEGKNPFYNYSLPKAVIRFKQGFGRLIRSQQDRGVIIALDNRLLKKNYGKIFLNSLPQACPVYRVKIKSLINPASSKELAK